MAIKTIIKPTEETLLRMMEIQWQDHFQTRIQTWKTLEIAAIIAVALVGINWRINSPLITTVTAILLMLVAYSGMQITLIHRVVEQNKFRIIALLEDQLGIKDPKSVLPESIKWWSIFKIHHSNTPLFILRMHFVILIFAMCYLIPCLFQLLKT
jgi:hypothetical protein